MTNVELAKLALLVLERQKQYFATRDRQDLIASKAVESQLRRAAESIVLAAERAEMLAGRQMSL